MCGAQHQEGIVTFFFFFVTQVQTQLLTRGVSLMKPCVGPYNCLKCWLIARAHGCCGFATPTVSVAFAPKHPHVHYHCIIVRALCISLVVL